MRTRRGDAFVVSDLDAPGWLERFSRPGPRSRPGRGAAAPGPLPDRPRRAQGGGDRRAEELLDLGFPGWRERTTWRSEALADGRTGAVDRPGTTWRDRPSVVRGDENLLAGDQVAAPGLLSEVSFTSGIEAALLAVKASRTAPGSGVDLNRT
ncbi:FAD-dependent oxidoreductase OS=Streptomyces microflavus OX=1919 GN=Smic_44380 PE=4 SV=1 [Streptomyces microflavus]